MNVRQLANSAITTINPNIVASVLRSTGYTIDANRRQVPSYAAAVTGPAQLQALSGSDLKQLEGLNLQGVMRAIYLRGVLAGVIRPDSTGGDLILIDDQKWLVVKVLEPWSGWTKAAIVLQESD
jgi:hypothetical protein